MTIYSVTQILSPFSKFDGIPAATLEAAKQRGLRVHAAAAAYLTGTFQVVQLLPEDEGYWASLKDWIDSMVDHVYDVEPELKDETLGFVGHPDLICKVGGKHTIVDFKTPKVKQKSWPIQISAYVHLGSLNYKHHSHSWRGMALQPDSKGNLAKATLYQYQQNDFAIFLSALNCHRYFCGDKNES